jgi:hypothetical protein
MVDLLGLSPAIIALIVVGIFVFLKIMKYATLIFAFAVLYLLAKFGFIPGIAPF